MWIGTILALITEILALRQEEAELLGYRHYADVSLVPKMAESAEQVESFARPSDQSQTLRRKDLAELRAFAHEQLGIADLQALGHHLRLREIAGQQRYAFSEQK